MEKIINKDRNLFYEYYSLLEGNKSTLKNEELENFINVKMISTSFSKENFIPLKGEFIKNEPNALRSEITTFEDNSDNSFEDSQSFLKAFFKDKETILNENWEKNETIQGKIINLNENEVFVDCLIDQENNIFQNRVFPIALFKNLTNLRVNKPVLIKTRLKPGAIRIDTFPGEGIVNLQLFMIKENWDSLKGKNLDTKLTKW